MNEFSTIQGLVEKMLKDYPATRENDIDLYLTICVTVNPIAFNMPFCDVVKKYKELGLPNPNTVSRVRRKLQEEHIEYRSSKRAEDGRYEKYKQAKEYAIS